MSRTLMNCGRDTTDEESLRPLTRVERGRWMGVGVRCRPVVGDLDSNYGNRIGTTRRRRRVEGNQDRKGKV